jgi:hypothetical protein
VFGVQELLEAVKQDRDRDEVSRNRRKDVRAALVLRPGKVDTNSSRPWAKSNLVQWLFSSLNGSATDFALFRVGVAFLAKWYPSNHTSSRPLHNWRTFPFVLSSHRAAAPDEMQHNRNQHNDQLVVDESAGDMKHGKPQ